MPTKYQKVETIPRLLLIVLAAFLLYAAHYNLSTLFHWSGKFWGWESAAVYYINQNFPEAVLYKDAVLVYPFGGTILINTISNVLNISLLHVETLLVYLSALAVGWTVYRISILYGHEDAAHPLAAVSILLGINVVNPIVYNSVSLALCTYAIYTVLRRRVVISAVAIGLTLIFKQNYGVGMLGGLLAWALMDSMLTKSWYADLFKVIVGAVLVALLLVGLAHAAGLISSDAFFELVYLGAGEQKGGIYNLALSSITTIARVVNLYLLLGFCIVLMTFWLDRKYPIFFDFADVVSKGMLPILIAIFLYSVTVVFSNSLELRAIFNRLDLQIVRQIFAALTELFKHMSLIFLAAVGVSYARSPFYVGSDATNSRSSKENRKRFYGLILLVIVFSLFIHLSSKVSNLVSYPSFLIIFGYLMIFDIIDVRYRKLLIRFLYIVTFAMFWNTFVAEKNGVSLVSSTFTKVTSNAYAKDVLFSTSGPDQVVYAMLDRHLSEQSTMQVLPDNLPVSSLYNNTKTLSHTDRCSVVNKFVDMFPDDRLVDEVECFLSNMPDFVLIVDAAYTTTWADRYVRKNSSGMQYVQLITPVIEKSYESLEAVELHGLSYELFRRR